MGTTVNYSNFIEIVAAWIILFILFALLIAYNPQKRIAMLKKVFLLMFIIGSVMYLAFHYLELQRVINGELEDSNMTWAKGGNVSRFYIIAHVVITSVMDVGMMFSGRGNSEVFYNLKISEYPLAVMLFWLIHMIAFYTSASALLIRFGSDFLIWIKMRIRMLFLWVFRKTLNVDIVFGVNEDSVTFGRNIADTTDMLIYVDSTIAEKFEGAIRDMGGLTYSDKNALSASPSFLREIHVKPRKTKLRLFALSSEYDMNLQYARNMSDSLRKAGIFPEQTELLLLGTDEWKGIFFQSNESRYGYGSVVSFNEFEISARLLINQYPLCNAINFDANGLATEDMNVLIVGFGRIGHEVLRKVIANGQFEGSNFHVTIYDPKFEHREGFFKSQFPMMFANYNIDFEPQDGRSTQIFNYIHDNAASLKYIVVCIEDKDTSRDIAIDIVDRLQALGHPQNVYTCDSKTVRCYSRNTPECWTHRLYDSELLYSGEFDRYAVALNHRYTGGKSAREDWKNCDYFGRMSSRAAVDYLIPLIRRITSEAQTLAPEQRENLGKSEHLRWCAFHYTFGYDVMSKEEFTQRVKDRQAEIAEHGSSKIKTTKDVSRKIHVCLVEWEELDEISRIENAITLGNVDYKKLDMENVNTVMEIMRAEDSAGKHYSFAEQ